MSENEHKNLEELLNSYIDGELSERQCNEVKRLVINNEQAAKLLKELQKCKALLGSLPRAQAPGHLFENVKASLERSVLLDEYHGKAGVVNLFARKMVTAAAMIALVGLLGFVIYNIVKPVSPPASHTAQILSRQTPITIAQPVIALSKMELQLQTDQATAVNQFIYRNIILDNGLQNNVTQTEQADKNVYSISCSSARAALILGELGTIWDKFNGTQLSIEGVDSPVANVTAAQAIQIAKETSAQGQIKLAKDFAAANKDIVGPPDNKAIIVADGKDKKDLPITKPALTSAAARSGPNEPADMRKISLTIVVTGM